MNEEDLKKYAIEVLGLKSCDACDDSGFIANDFSCFCWLFKDSVFNFINSYTSIDGLEDIYESS